jgi:hypothetical protein
MKQTLQSIEHRLQMVETNTDFIPAVRAAVTEQSAHLKNHESRLRSLEQPA